MLNKSYTVLLIGLLSMIMAAVILYFDMSTTIAYILLASGFVLIGVGILLGFIKMVSETK